MKVDIAIKVENLKKSYGNNYVVKGISFEVLKGETFALLGVNGAGKTTTLECIEGIRKFDSGNVSVDGSIGVQLQSTSLYANIKAKEAFILFCKWNHTDPNWQLFDDFGITEFQDLEYREMSTGQKRRLHLAIALINDPDIIFLDEPTAGLDVEGRSALHDEIRKLKKQGKTILIASHDMAEVETLSDRIAILKEGNIAFLGTSKQLTTVFSTGLEIHIKTSKPLDLFQLDNSTYIGSVKEYESFKTEKLGEGLLELLQSIKNTGNQVLDIRIMHPTLEQKFIDIAKGVNGTE